MKSSAVQLRRQQRLKCVVIPALVLILVAVLFWPAGDQADSPVAASVAVKSPRDTAPPVTAQPASAHAGAASAAGPRSADRPPAGSAAAVDSAAGQRWPELPLHEITAVNPFVKQSVAATPPPAPQGASTQVADAEPATMGPWLQLATGLAGLAQRRVTNPAAAVAELVRQAPAPPQAPVAQETAVPSEPVAVAGGSEEPAGPALAIDYATIGRLNAIVHGASGPQALLDGNRIVHEGDQVPGGFQVVQITDREIWVRPVQP